METSEDYKRQYERVRERISKLEAEREGYLARGEPVPLGVRCNLARDRATLDEIRLHGQRAHVREVQDAQRTAAERDMRDRVTDAWQRIDRMPVLTPDEMRRKRKELGARQQDVAAFAGVALSTVNKAETGGKCEPLTLKLIALGLEEIAEAHD
jgi:DNA-binding XRE family transcriptional regulator